MNNVLIVAACLQARTLITPAIYRLGESRNTNFKEKFLCEIYPILVG